MNGMNEANGMKMRNGGGDFGERMRLRVLSLAPSPKSPFPVAQHAFPRKEVRLSPGEGSSRRGRRKQQTRASALPGANLSPPKKSSYLYAIQARPLSRLHGGAMNLRAFILLLCFSCCSCNLLPRGAIELQSKEPVIRIHLAKADSHEDLIVTYENRSRYFIAMSPDAFPFQENLTESTFKVTDCSSGKELMFTQPVFALRESHPKRLPLIAPGKTIVRRVNISSAYERSKCLKVTFNTCIHFRRFKRQEQAKTFSESPPIQWYEFLNELECPVSGIVNLKSDR